MEAGRSVATKWFGKIKRQFLTKRFLIVFFILGIFLKSALLIMIFDIHIRPFLLTTLILSDFFLLAVFLIVYIYHYYKKVQSTYQQNKNLENDKNQLMLDLKTYKGLAFYDTLTNLPNRRYCMNILNSAIKIASIMDNKKIAVLILDIDRFKYVNDTFGHDIGDMVLVEISKRIKTSIMNYGTVFRLGDDEFLILIDDDCTVDDIKQLSSNIIKSFSEPFIVKEMNFHVSTSIGAALYPKHGDNVEALLKHADIAMYKAKKGGRNTYRIFNNHYAKEMDIDITIKAEVIQAIKEKTFVMHYQPKIGVKCGKIKGWEALIRYVHPVKGIVYPNDFISVSEKTGLINKIDVLALEMTCIQIKSLVNKGIDPGTISVNISANQFMSPDFINTIDRVLLKTSINPSYLGLEITEYSIIEDLAYANSVISQIKLKGIKISLDDFGTGYSSLSYTKSLPIDVLKIDKMFVDELCNDNVNQTIIESVIAIANALDIEVVAEGVVSYKQLDILKKLNCDEYQGYLYSEPVSGEMMEKILQNSLT